MNIYLMFIHINEPCVLAMCYKHFSDRVPSASFDFSSFCIPFPFLHQVLHPTPPPMHPPTVISSHLDTKQLAVFYLAPTNPPKTPVFLFTPRCVSVSEMLRNLIHICSRKTENFPFSFPNISPSYLNTLYLEKWLASLLQYVSF